MKLYWAPRTRSFSALWILGERFSAADVMIGSGVHFGLAYGLLERRPAFDAYDARCTARPAFARVGDRRGSRDALRARSAYGARAGAGRDCAPVGSAREARRHHRGTSATPRTSAAAATGHGTAGWGRRSRPAP